jgi:hypothetical protein
MHTSAVAAAVAERAEATAFTNELPENLANGHMERDTNGHHQRLQLVQEAVAVYDEMRDALRQTTTTNNQAAVSEVDLAAQSPWTAVTLRAARIWGWPM